VTLDKTAETAKKLLVGGLDVVIDFLEGNETLPEPMRPHMAVLLRLLFNAWDEATDELAVLEDELARLTGDGGEST
jgi:hypothetical protein